jgi:AraC family transcriptional regulator
MSGGDFVLQLARLWGAAPSDIVSGLQGQRIMAAHWRHNVPEFPDTPVPSNFVAMLLKPAVAERVHGGRLVRPAVAPGSMMIAPRGIGGRWIFGSEVETLHVYLPQPLLDTFSRSGGRVELNDDLDASDVVLQRLMLDIQQAMDGEAADQLYADTLGVALAARLADLHACGGAAPRRLSGGLAAWQVRRVTDYLSSHLHETVPLAELAAIAGLSPFHFVRAFKHSTGLPPHAWLTQRRIERARELMLAHPAMPLMEVALCIGYASQTAFGAAFKRVVGMTPAEWRRERLG